MNLKFKAFLLTGPLSLKAELAASILSNLPSSLLQLFESEQWKGGPLLVMASTTARPSMQEVATNHVWLRPMVAFSPSKAVGFKPKSCFSPNDCFFKVSKGPI